MNAADHFAHWRPVRSDLLQALDMLSDVLLLFVRAPGLWSLGRVGRHIAYALEGWFRHVVTGELEAWPRCPDDDYASVQALKALLKEVHARTESCLETLGGPDLDRAVKTPRGEQLSLRWIIWHVLEHEIHHRGEIFLMLGLMGLEAPQI